MDGLPCTSVKVPPRSIAIRMFRGSIAILMRAAASPSRLNGRVPCGDRPVKHLYGFHCVLKKKP
jgi:hypothetical protein